MFNPSKKLPVLFVLFLSFSVLLATTAMSNDFIENPEMIKVEMRAGGMKVPLEALRAQSATVSIKMLMASDVEEEIMWDVMQSDYYKAFEEINGRCDRRFYFELARLELIKKAIQEKNSEFNAEDESLIEELFKQKEYKKKVEPFKDDKEKLQALKNEAKIWIKENIAGLNKFTKTCVAPKKPDNFLQNIRKARESKIAERKSKELKPTSPLESLQSLIKKNKANSANDEPSTPPSP